MTQTLMDFMQLVTRPGARRIQPKAPRASRLDDLRCRFDAALYHLNAKVASRARGGRLVAAPLCPAACHPGRLADLLERLGTHPFANWNMMLYADTAETADALDTIAFDPALATDTDEIMANYIASLGEAPMRAFARLKKDCAEIEATLFGARQNWNRYLDLSAPPNAAINPAISAGTIASKDISRASVG